jgi:hypothetical protein
MRKYFVGVLALAVGASVFAAAALAVTSPDPNTQTFKATVASSTQSQTVFHGASLKMVVLTETTPPPADTSDTCTGGPYFCPGYVPHPGVSARLDFDNDIKVYTRGLPQCRTSLEGKTTADAIAACPNAVVGHGTATSRVGSGSGTFIPVNDVVLTLFNGKPDAAGHPRLLIHSRTDSQGLTFVLRGVIKPSTFGADYGKSLNIAIPELAAGNGALIRFVAKVKRTFHKNGHTYHLVSARCHDGNHKWNYHGLWKFSQTNGNDMGAGPQGPLNATSKQTCSVA